MNTQKSSVVFFVTPILIVVSIVGVWLFREETKVSKTQKEIAPKTLAVGIVEVDPCSMMVAGSTPITRDSVSCTALCW
jgi:hypothetical protein